MCSVTTYAAILIPFPFIFCFGPSHICHKKVIFLFWFGLEVHSEKREQWFCLMLYKYPLVFVNFLFCLSFWPNCLVFIAFSLFGVMFLNSSSMPDHCCRLDFTRKISHWPSKNFILDDSSPPSSEIIPSAAASPFSWSHVVNRAMSSGCDPVTVVAFHSLTNFFTFFWKDHGKIVLQIKC